MKGLRALSFVLLILGMARPAAAWGRLNDSEEPGSVLVFHKFARGFAGPFAKTDFVISVTCPTDTTCNAMGQTVHLRAHWVCPGKPICNEIDFNLKTTVNGTIVFDPENFGLTNTDTVPKPPCDRGYLIVWAVDASGRPISFNGLIGHAFLHDGNGGAILAGFADVNYYRAYNALPIQASVASGHTIPSPLVFDGTAYQAITGTIYGTVRFPSILPTIQRTFLILLTLDVRSNRPNNPTFVDLNFYNEGEILTSTSTHFVCWEEFQLTDLNPILSSDFFGHRGLVRSTKAEKVQAPGVSDRTGPVTLVGIVETLDDSLANSAAYLLYNDSKPVATTFTP